MTTLVLRDATAKRYTASAMPVFISMLRGVNVVRHNRIKMDALRAVYQSLKLENPRTYVQSGNVIFRTRERNAVQLAKKIQEAIARRFGFRPDVILRTPEDFRRVIAANPFARRQDIDPGKLLVTFLAVEPGAEGRARLLAVKPDPEELHLIGREIYIYFPNGAGRSKLQWAALGEKLGTPGTARNWNSVVSMLEIAEETAASD